LEEVFIISVSAFSPPQKEEKGPEKKGRGSLGESKEEMRRFFCPLLAGILLLTFQSTLLAYLPIHRFRPDIVLMMILFLAFLIPPSKGDSSPFVWATSSISFREIPLAFMPSPNLLFLRRTNLQKPFLLEGSSFQFLFVLLLRLLEGFSSFFLRPV